MTDPMTDPKSNPRNNHITGLDRQNILIIIGITWHVDLSPPIVVHLPKLAHPNIFILQSWKSKKVRLSQHCESPFCDNLWHILPQHCRKWWIQIQLNILMIFDLDAPEYLPTRCHFVVWKRCGTIISRSSEHFRNIGNSKYVNLITSGDHILYIFIFNHNLMIISMSCAHSSCGKRNVLNWRQFFPAFF